MSHMTLGELHDRLTAICNEDPDRVLPFGFAHPHSYRGDYADIAFSLVRNVPLATCLQTIIDTINTPFEGYKGGTYFMSSNTQGWIAKYGRLGTPLTTLTLTLLLSHHLPECDTCYEEVKTFAAEYTR